ncbi:MAG: hypothetical protein CME19_18520 [Gemmatimonadetes bacterium]|nr:hypothetical protein [Gemmatimonadota bacterium]
MAGFAVNRTSEGWLLFLGVCGLFVFSALVPHPYVYSLDPGLLGRIVSAVPLLTTGLCAFLLFVAFWRLDSRPGLAEVYAVVGVWLLLAALSGLGSERPGYALLRDVHYALTGVAIVPVTQRVLTGRTEVTCRILTVTTGLVGALCLYEFVIGTPALWSSLLNADNARYARFAPDDFGRRVLGPVGHPVYLGSFLALMFPASLWALLQSSRGRQAVLSATTVVCILGGMLLTFSRGAWLAAAIAVLVYLRHHSARMVWRILLALGVLLTLAFSVDQVWDTLASRGTIGQIKAFDRDQRGIAYRHGMAILHSSPVVGVGTGLYRFAAARSGDADHTPDNQHLRLLAEHGVAGFSAFALLVVVIVRTLNRGRMALTEDGRIGEADLCAAIAAGIIGFCVNILTCDGLYFSTTRISFWMMVGVGLATVPPLARSRCDT